MNSIERRRVTFDQVAELYERVRPGYPEALVDDVVRDSGVPAGGRILEIGSGTGKATRPFAARGFDLTCIEPGPNLARVARATLAGIGTVRIVESTFEAYATEETFDLVIAAQSFHFVDPPTGMPRVARLLRHGGAVAIFGNQPQPGFSETHGRVQEAYARFAPELLPDTPPTPIAERIDATDAFGPVTARRYPWRREFPAADYADLMNTQSDHRLLPDARRESLLAAIRDAIERCGGTIAIDYVTTSYLARRR